MELKKKYGLATAIAMVVGIMIGSGVFFKAGTVLEKTGGNLVLGILAWLIGGVVMLVSAYAFSILSSKVEKAGGVVDYMESMCGKKAGYYIGWYMSMIYLPILTSVLSWLCGMYTAILFGLDSSPSSNVTILFSIGYMVVIYFVNAISPIIAGKLQVTTTVIKIVPLIFIAIVGTLFGLFSSDGKLVENFTNVVNELPDNGFFGAIVATAFAYDGWIVVTSINKELRESKKNLPKALIVGGLIVLTIYILYFIGLSGIYPTSDFIGDSQGTVKEAFLRLLGGAGGNILFTFVIISCIGTLNGLTMATTRGVYALAVRNQGINPEVFKVVDEKTNVPSNSAAIGLLLTAIWFVLWIGNFLGWYNTFIDFSEICIIFLYGSYIPIYVMMVIKNKDMNIFNRYVVPIIALLAAVFIVIACIYAHEMACLYFLIIVIAICMVAFIIDIVRQKKTK